MLSTSGEKTAFCSAWPDITDHDDAFQYDHPETGRMGTCGAEESDIWFSDTGNDDRRLLP
jgi:hypothetical protein